MLWKNDAEQFIHQEQVDEASRLETASWGQDCLLVMTVDRVGGLDDLLGNRHQLFYQDVRLGVWEQRVT